MNDHRFPISGTEIPQMMGRARVMDYIWKNLTKTTPGNLSIIGPRFVGKTVIMNALAKRITNEDSPYEFVLHWHLGHLTPGSDTDFITELSDELSRCLAQSTTTSEYRKHLEEHSYSNLAEVADFLDEEGRPILMLWDGFDKPLGQGKLTGQLWDQMRNLFYGKKHKIVTATRKPLSELLRSQDSITSPFWNIFDMNPVRIEAFDEEDRETIIQELSTYSFQAGAKTELLNWSAGFPPLFLGVLNQISTDIPDGQVNNEVVNCSAVKQMESLSHMLKAMWEDCSEGAKGLYVQLVERGDLTFDDVGKNERNCLIEKGFARKSGNKLAFSCRMLQEHIRGAMPDTGSMARLFRSQDDYQSNIRTLLELRLAHISHFDDGLRRLVARAIEDIPAFPDDCLNNLTGIRDKALQLIWKHEFGDEMQVPPNIIDYWTSTQRPYNKLLDDMIHSNNWKVSNDPLTRIRLLGLLTGSVRGFSNKADKISKDGYVLINAIHNFRNFSQHPDGESIHLGVAVVAIMLCLELLACLEREIT